MSAVFDLDQLIKSLNEFVATDQEAIKLLIENRVPCNEEMKNHPTIQVQCDKEGNNPEVGLLGILNGLIGIHHSGWGYLSAEMEEGGRLIEFKRSPGTEEDDG